MATTGATSASTCCAATTSRPSRATTTRRTVSSCTAPWTATPPAPATVCAAATASIASSTASTCRWRTPPTARCTSPSPALVKAQTVATISQFYMPSFTGSGISGPNVYASNMRVPIDDESCFHYRLRWSYEPFSQQQVWEDKYGGYTYPEQVPGTFLAKENKDNELPCRPPCPEELLLHRHQGLPHPGPGACRGPVGPPRRPQPGEARHVRPEHHRRAPSPHQRGPRPDGGRGAQRPQQTQTPTESTPPA